MLACHARQVRFRPVQSSFFLLWLASMYYCEMNIGEGSERDREKEPVHRWFSGECSPIHAGGQVRFPADAVRFLSLAPAAFLLRDMNIGRAVNVTRRKNPSHRWFSGRMLACHAGARMIPPMQSGFFLLWLRRPSYCRMNIGRAVNVAGE
ncbi:hypothetical protein NPIL_304541 [Nephila pilipes]|uniref:Secreted protein n=1 Tax=Nephila pilipes TaxID=299642 RepID=A0A8X6TVS4_NEPPI|nr:hypothetical protein NPIL_304541 [Nephila pilipes]